MKFEIPIEHVWSTLRLGCPSHSIYDRLQIRKVRLRLRREICRKAFDRAAHLVELDDVLLSEIDDASASAAFLGDEDVALQKIDRFSDSSLRHTKVLRPPALDNSLARRQSPVHNLCQEFFGQRFLDEALGRVCGRCRHKLKRLKWCSVIVCNELFECQGKYKHLNFLAP